MYEFDTTIYLCVMALFFALTEVNSEGQYGWAYAMPTYYRVTTVPAKVFGWLWSAPLTGYHLVLFPIPFMIMSYPAMVNDQLSPATMMESAGIYAGFTIVWDFWWFVLNPHFGLRRFRRECVPWKSRQPWLWNRVPLGYILLALAAPVFATVGGAMEGDWVQAARGQSMQVGYFILASVGLIPFAPLYHRYYMYMRRSGSDEREVARRMYGFVERDQA